MDNRWNELILKAHEQDLNIIEGVFTSFNITSLSIIDPRDKYDLEAENLNWLYDESERSKKENDEILIKTYIKEKKDVEKLIVELENKLNKFKNEGLIKNNFNLSYDVIIDENWVLNFKKHYKTIKIGNRFVINPTWINYQPQKKEILITMDPGIAFGTGDHETTKMCLISLEENIKKGMTVIDVGTGTGVLAIASDKLGAKNVIGIDLDKDSVNYARENIVKNKALNTKIIHGNLMQDIDEKADLIIANILYEVIEILISDVIKKLKKGGIFISSGIIKDREDKAISLMKENGFEILDIKRDGEWILISARR